MTLAAGAVAADASAASLAGLCFAPVVVVPVAVAPVVVAHLALDVGCGPALRDIPVTLAVLLAPAARRSGRRCPP